MLVELTNYKVEIKDSITWGEKESINSEYAKLVKPDMKTNEIEMSLQGAFDVKYKALEVCIISIKDKDENVIPYTKDWAYNLSQSDGNKLYEAVDSIVNEKKN